MNLGKETETLGFKKITGEMKEEFRGENIHPGMITVYSPGAYVSKHKPEEYIKDNIESEIRNATIAKILYLCKSIEQFCSGFKRINSLCNDAGIK